MTLVIRVRIVKGAGVDAHTARALDLLKVKIGRILIVVGLNVAKVKVIKEEAGGVELGRCH